MLVELSDQMGSFVEKQQIIVLVLHGHHIHQDYTNFYEDDDVFTEWNLHEKGGVFVVFFEAAFTEAFKLMCYAYGLWTYFNAY